ncbi:hypothetical protein L1887_48056 [Cichorium endivia]|nr:hypothetical protein L1887_48056 [Cichorium endivia]
MARSGSLGVSETLMMERCDDRRNQTARVVGIRMQSEGLWRPIGAAAVMDDIGSQRRFTAAWRAALDAVDEVWREAKAPSGCRATLSWVMPSDASKRKKADKEGLSRVVEESWLRRDGLDGRCKADADAE